MSAEQQQRAEMQIRQMVNFIMQEAHEKCNEIKIKSDHDYQVEMQSLVHAGKLAAQEEYAQRTKDFEVQKRVEESNSQAAARVRMMKARDDMLEQLKRDSLSKLAVMVGTPAYPKLLRNLILQGLIKLQEPVVEVRCRAGDKGLVTTALADALKECNKKLQAAGYTHKVQATVSSKDLSSKGVSGGVILTALNGKIQLDQTLEERAAIAYEVAMPEVRKRLFGENAKKVA